VPEPTACGAARRRPSSYGDRCNRPCWVDQSGTAFQPGAWWPGLQLVPETTASNYILATDRLRTGRQLPPDRGSATLRPGLVGTLWQ
jgi:hypothetical protein